MGHRLPPRSAFRRAVRAALAGVIASVLLGVSAAPSQAFAWWTQGGPEVRLALITATRIDGPCATGAPPQVGSTCSILHADGPGFSGTFTPAVTVLSPGGAQLRLDSPARAVTARAGATPLPVDATPDPRYWIVHMAFALDDRTPMTFSVDHVPQNDSHETASWALMALRPVPAPAPASPPPSDGDRPGAPLVELGAAASQRLPAIELTAETDETATLRADATVAVSKAVAKLGAAQRSARSYRVPAVGADAPARTRVTLRLRVPGRAVSAIKARLKRGRRATARVRVLATDLAGNQRTALRTIRIAR